ncbi:putative baseplate assembly protein [Caballeronia humi]|uniref:putative baseplate assembly protein n=1 Tax=Caballeronia humi TaxID=326474 RepID=UPI000B3E9CC6|nr:putative baseplate assembly protein [Caballeronia humi]
MLARELESQAQIVVREQDRDPLREALGQVFAHYCDVLTDRLNRAPDAHLFAFTQLLGAAREAAVPARAPLVFKAARGAANVPVPVVPRYTEVAAPPAAGESEAVVFQTEADLEVVRADITRAVAVDTGRRLVADANGVLAGTGLPPGVDPFAHAVPLMRAMLIGHPTLWATPDLIGFSLQADIARPGAREPGTQLSWGIATADGFAALTPLLDTTNGLTQSGEVRFGALTEGVRVTPFALHGVTNCWLTCRIVPAVVRPAPQAPAADSPSEPAKATATAPATPEAPSASARTASAPLTIAGLRLFADRALEAAPVEAALFGRLPLDVTRDFYPFGERPRFGDVFYLASGSFAIANARAVLSIQLTNPAGVAPDASPIPPVSRAGDPRVQWEMHTRAGWVPIAVDDKTHALTRNGAVSFGIPADVEATSIGGVTSGWLRVRLVSGNYVPELRPADPVVIPIDAPPSIARIRVSMSLHIGPVLPERVVIEDGLEARHVVVAALPQFPAFSPFQPYDTEGRALYLALAADPAQLAKRTLNVYFALAANDARPVCRVDESAFVQRWQVRGATRWHDCTVIDRTGALMHPGIVSVTIGEDVAPWTTTALDPNPALVWLRVMLAASVATPGDEGALVPVADPDRLAAARASVRPAGSAPCDDSALLAVRLIALNAVSAIQSIRLERELVGSSSGRPSQSFRLARSPVVGEVLLEVREGQESQPVDPRDWVRWTCVEDFTGASHDARVFTLDRTSGTVRFGDGRHGRIPPAGGNSVRASYNAGGGARGNQPACTVAQLRTTIPYIQSAANCDAATGGQDAVDNTWLRATALARIRHRDRAVCAEDYADLARRASPQVARAMCRGARDLSKTGASNQPEQGVVSVLIVPHSADAEPQPARALLERVRSYLLARCAAGVEVILLGPAYLRASVDAQIVVASGASPVRVAAACEARVNAFLHPVTGNAGGEGWSFGEIPHASDLLAMLRIVDGIDHVRGLRIFFDASEPDLRERGDFLVCAGRHTIRASG